LQQCEDQRALRVGTCGTLETTTIRIFASYGWPSLFKIGFLRSMRVVTSRNHSASCGWPRSACRDSEPGQPIWPRVTVTGPGGPLSSPCCGWSPWYCPATAFPALRHGCGCIARSTWRPPHPSYHLPCHALGVCCFMSSRWPAHNGDGMPSYLTCPR